MDALADPPTQLEVEFGLKFDADANAIVAKAGTEAGFTVTLMWEREEKPVRKRPRLV